MTTRPRVAVTERCIKTPGKLPNVHAPKVKLPPASPEVRHKIRAHLICVLFGGLLALVLTFTANPTIVHMVPFVPSVPSAWMELLDRLNNR